MSGPLAGAPACPGCGQLADGYSAVGPEKEEPGDGDYSICVYCRAVSKFVVQGDDISLRPMTTEELVEFRRDPLCQVAIKVVATLHREHGPPRPS